MWRKEDVIKKLKADQGTRSLRQYAAAIGCSTSNIAQTYSGAREPSKQLLDYLNLEKEEVQYREKKENLPELKRRWK